MDCKIGVENLIDFYFGKINPADREKVESHLAVCSACLGNYFELKRDFESEDGYQSPAELTKQRVRRDFSDYCAHLISEEKRAWVYSNRIRIGVGFLAIAAALVSIVYSGRLNISHDRIHDRPAYEQGEIKSLDEAVDSGRLSPGHINMI